MWYFVIAIKLQQLIQAHLIRPELSFNLQCNFLWLLQSQGKKILIIGNLSVKSLQEMNNLIPLHLGTKEHSKGIGFQFKDASDDCGKAMREAADSIPI